MSNPQMQSNVWQKSAAAVDVGLRQYMLRVYNTMAMGVGVTGLVAYFVVNSPALLLSLSQMYLLLFVAILGLGWFAPKLILTKSVAAGHMAFWAYVVLWGLAISPLIAISLKADVARAFFITSAIFASMSLYGYTTKRDLSPLGKFLFMASIGLLIALVVNFFVQSGPFDLILSIGVVLIFSALTAYKTQMIKDSYDPADDEGTSNSKAIFGAFLLYGAFITIFIYVLHILNIFSGD